MARHEQEKTLITFETIQGQKPILLTLKRYNAEDAYYRFSQGMPLRTLFQDYCFRTKLVYKDTNFVYNDCRIHESTTPEDLDMLDTSRDHVIHVFSSHSVTMVDQSSGCRLGYSGDGEPPFVLLTVREFTSVDGGGDHECYYYYKVSRIVPLRFLMSNYCQRRGFPSEYVFFRYRKVTDGGEQVHHVFNDEYLKSPNELEMNDHDVLYACFDRRSKARLHRENTEERAMITLRVSGQNGMTISYKMNRKMPLKPLMIDYCNHFGLSLDKFRFVYDGCRLWNGEKTAEEWGMEEEEVAIDVFKDPI